MRVFLVALLFFLPVMGHCGQVEDALVSLCDPAKIATLSERGANPRVRKITYWLEIGRREGKNPAVVMRGVMERVGWVDQKGKITAEAMLRNRIIAERLGCLYQMGMVLLRRGNAPKVKNGPYAGSVLSVDHIIPRSVAPELDNVLANLELMPQEVNGRKGASIGSRQIDLAQKLYSVGLLSKDGYDAVHSRQYSGAK